MEFSDRAFSREISRARTFGFLRDAYGSYDPALWLSSVSLLGAVAVLFAGGRATSPDEGAPRPASALSPNIPHG